MNSTIADRGAAVAMTLALCLANASPCTACFSIVVGKNVSADGCVLVAHNEDDSPPQIVNHHKVPRRTHQKGEMLTLGNGGQVEQVPQTWAYLWSEMPGMPFSDSFVNEWGVCVTSDNCPSRETQGELTDGGIGKMLRRLVAERARTARDGVRIASELVERFGYVASGRTYIIADPEEGWLFCAIQGKRWLARRVDDDEVAMVANTYTVREVDLADTENVLASQDIRSYAVKRGWCDSDEGKPFDFAATYADPASAAHPVNYGRQAIGLRYVALNPEAIDNKPPFSVVPSEKLGVTDLMTVLRHSGSGRSICSIDGRQIDCGMSEAICRGTTQTSFVARLGTQPSRELGIVYWVCLAAPETSVFIPFHFGIPDFPAGFRSESQRPTSEFFARKITSPFQPDPSQAFWTFANFRHKAEKMPDSQRSRIRAEAEAIEASTLLANQTATEGLHSAAPDATMKLLQALPANAYLSALTMMTENLASE